MQDASRQPHSDVHSTVPSRPPGYLSLNGIVQGGPHDDACDRSQQVQLPGQASDEFEDPVSKAKQTEDSTEYGDYIQARPWTSSRDPDYGGRPDSAKQKEDKKEADKALKLQIKEQLKPKEYDVTTFYWDRGLWPKIARSPSFEKMTLGVISLNAIWIGVDTDWNTADVLLSAEPTFQIAEHGFCVYFCFEWYVRFMSFKRKRDGCRDFWFVFDTCLVLMMFLETWVMTAVILAAGGGSGAGLGNASILRMARLLRLSRMARMARLFRAMPELLILVKGIAAAMRSVVITLLLLAILIYVFGIAFTQLLAGKQELAEKFGTVVKSMHTLLLNGTLLDGVGDVVKGLHAEHWVYVMVFYLFVLLSALTVMNMLIGVLCEIVSDVAVNEKAKLSMAYVRRMVEEAMEETRKARPVTKADFEAILKNKKALEAFEKANVELKGLAESINVLFKPEEEREFTVHSFGVALYEHCFRQNLIPKGATSSFMFQDRFRMGAQGSRGLIEKALENAMLQVEMERDPSKCADEISKADLASIVGNKRACEALQEVGVDVFVLVDNMEAIFAPEEREWEDGDDDDDESAEPKEKKLSFDDFTEVIYSLRGTNTATLKDILETRKIMQKMEKRLKEEVRRRTGGRLETVRFGIHLPTSRRPSVCHDDSRRPSLCQDDIQAPRRPSLCLDGVQTVRRPSVCQDALQLQAPIDAIVKRPSGDYADVVPTAPVLQPEAIIAQGQRGTGAHHSVAQATREGSLAENRHLLVDALVRTESQLHKLLESMPPRCVWERASPTQEAEEGAPEITTPSRPRSVNSTDASMAQLDIDRLEDFHAHMCQLQAIVGSGLRKLQEAKVWLPLVPAKLASVQKCSSAEARKPPAPAGDAGAGPPPSSAVAEVKATRTVTVESNDMSGADYEAVYGFASSGVLPERGNWARIFVTAQRENLHELEEEAGRRILQETDPDTAVAWARVLYKEAHAGNVKARGLLDSMYNNMTSDPKLVKGIMDKTLQAMQSMREGLH